MIKQGLDISHIRNQFPFLKPHSDTKPLIYFDNGATTQKPLRVIQGIVDYYTHNNANIHRGVHTLSQKATTLYDNARKYVSTYLNAKHPHEIVFTKGTTDSINFLASCFAQYISQGDEIIISEMEHHSNILPWQILCKKKNAILKIAPINLQGDLLLDELNKLISPQTKLISITHVSNTLGTVNPVKDIVALAHQHNIPVMIDGAQAAPHLKIDLQDLNADFYCFSGHKMYASTGIGVLYAKEKYWNSFEPYQTGGGTIKSVTFNETLFADLPHKFEAGTPHIEGAISLANALKFITDTGIDNITRHEHELIEYATEKLSEIDTLTIIGRAKNKAGVISFVVPNTHPFDIGTLLDKQGIAVRTGHHCTQPLMQKYNLPGTVRISFAVYNTLEEIDYFISALKKTIKMLQ
jgi:cysteine desulfurase/selenocysteine lyase